MRIIDARLRPPTPNFLRSTLGLSSAFPRFCNYSKWFGFENSGESAAKGDISLCVKEMDDAGVDMGIIPCRWGGLSESPEPEIAPEEAFEVMDTYPGRFATIIAAGVGYPDRALQDAEKYCVNGPAIGLNLEFVSDDPAYPKVCDKKFYPLYEYMQEKELILYVTGGGFGGCQPVEYIGKVLSDFPHLTVVDAHAHVPDVMQACFMAFRHENYYLLPDLYVPNSFFEHVFVDAAKSMLQDQILFGTAYPFMPIRETTDYYLHWPLPDKILEKVMGGNAARIMHL